MRDRFPQTGSSEVDAVIERASMGIERVRNRMGEQGMQGVAHKARRALRRMQRFMLMALGGIIALLMTTAIVGGTMGGIGFFGVLAVIAAVPLVLLIAFMFSRESDVRAETIVQASLPQLADRTRSWIDQQRLALPAPAATLADHIGQRIASLQPQLATLDANAPEARELRRLVGEELPHLVEGYKRVPTNLRRESRNGRVAEQELIDGMKLLDEEVDDLARAIAATDMDRLSSHKRYLEMRYKGDEN
jgi:uncharacterized membrane protein YbaN (DUF454 family)